MAALFGALCLLFHSLNESVIQYAPFIKRVEVVMSFHFRSVVRNASLVLILSLSVAGSWLRAADQPPAAPPALIAPLGESVSTQPTFQWSSVPNTDRYDLWVDGITQPASQIIREQALTATEHTHASALSNNQVFRFWVRAGNDAGWGPWSTAGNFAVYTTAIKVGLELTR